MTSPYHHGNLRAALLARAVEVLSTAGIETLSLRALARDLEVSHAAPLRHFKTKADLLSAIAVAGAESLTDKVQLAADTPPGRPSLLAISRAYLDWAFDHPAYYRVLRNPEVMRHAPAEVATLLTAFADGQRSQIRQAQSQGWRPDDDPEDILLQLAALTVGSAGVATDPIYPKPGGNPPSRNKLTLLIERFLGLDEAPA